MDIVSDMVYRGYLVNDSNVQANVTPPDEARGGIRGCVVDSFDLADVDVVQSLEKNSQRDGSSAGDVYLGVRRTRIAGTLYGVTRASLFDDLFGLRAAFNPVLAQRDSPADKGYQPFLFSVPTERTADYPTGIIPLQIKAMPRAFQQITSRDSLGGQAPDALGVEWQATLVSKDPAITAQTPQDYVLAGGVTVTGVTVPDTAGFALVTKTAHGLVANDTIVFTGLTGGTGLATSTTYYVLGGGMTANAFYISLTPNGGAKAITVSYTDAQYIKSLATSGNVSNRGTYLASVNMLIETGTVAGTIGVTVGDSVFTITVPASSNPRTLRFKGADTVFTLEELGVETPRRDLLVFSGIDTWPEITPGLSAYSVTATGATILTGSHMWFYEQYA
jgi:hypothetical protein